ncbi:hypothetical protein JHK82_020310 [Glycine max]|uniref:Uncharacterized protein n=1 Tax=Glycine soja TaxID=3848 RepID=A0A445J961_GLYSO|nr:hypothetical protein JHK85_020764 [Glycine max]KAG5135579.1 hypothetical protein JHK82_020310 [Glycine max]RZB94999.1 hypothetical protein D0Y65_019458 [Glycine soja]
MGGAEYNFKGCYGGSVDWHIWFIEVTYQIWKARNEWVFLDIAWSHSNILNEAKAIFLQHKLVDPSLDIIQPKETHRRVLVECLFILPSKVATILWGFDGKVATPNYGRTIKFSRSKLFPYQLIPSQIGSLQGLLPRFLIRLNLMQRAFLIGNLHHQDF